MELQYFLMFRNTLTGEKSWIYAPDWGALNDIKKKITEPEIKVVIVKIYPNKDVENILLS